MFIPGKKIFDELFQSDRAAWMKISGAALLGGLLYPFYSFLGGFEFEKENVTRLIIITICFIMFFSFGAFFLCLKDIVHKRIEENRPVNLFLRMYFAMGRVSTVIWVVTAVGLTILFTTLVIVFE